MNILDQIIQSKRKEIETIYGNAEELNFQPDFSNRKTVDFKKALNKGRLCIISEVKKASPSKGVIRPDFNPTEIAQSYTTHDTDAISILTESEYFQGAPEYLTAIREISSVPIIRKDFIVDRRQIKESRRMGADAILLIVAALNTDQISEYIEEAHKVDLQCLVEVHTRAELDIAVQCGAEIIGVNNRNLKTFKTDIQQSIDLRPHIPDHVTCISESGIKNSLDCQKLWSAGFHAILVGEQLMRQENPGAAIKLLLYGESA